MPTSTESKNWIFIYSVTVASATLLLIFAGGLVTSHEAGLAVPDWPTSYGILFPPMVGNIFWEHGHRMIAGAVGIMTLILAIWIQWGVDAGLPAGQAGFPRPGAETAPLLSRLGWIAVAAVITQAVLGGITVIFLLPPVISITHACLAQTFFGLTIAIAYFLNRSVILSEAKDPEILRPAFGRPQNDGMKFKGSDPSWFSGPFWFSVLTLILVYVQLILGATVRHTGHALVPHIISAFAVAGMILSLSFRLISQSDIEKPKGIRFPELPASPARFAEASARRAGGREPGIGWFMEQKGLRFLGFSLAFLVLIQFFLGLGSFIFTRVIERTGYIPSAPEILFTAIHQTTGALILGLMVLTTLILWRR